MISLIEYVPDNHIAAKFEKLVSEALDKADNYLFGTWIQNHRLAAEPFSAEKYYTYCDCGNYMETWVKS